MSYSKYLRKRAIDSELSQQVLEHPDRFQYEHAQIFGVT